MDRAYCNYKFKDNVSMPLDNFKPLGNWVILETDDEDTCQYITVRLHDRIIINKGMEHIINEWHRQGLLERVKKVE